MTAEDHVATTKSCASNSGKRGSRSRRRGGVGGCREDANNDNDGVDDSSLGRFNGLIVGGYDDRARESCIAVMLSYNIGFASNY